jgi:hypothetical protein
MFFMTLFYCWREMKIETLCSWDKKIWLTENNGRPNRDDSDPVLIMTIDLDLGSERAIRCRCTKWPDIKSHKIRSVASRSRGLMILLDKLFICQSESNLLCSISRVSETKPTRNGRCTPWSSVVWSFEIPKCDGRNCLYCVLGHSDTLCALWQW